MAGGSSGYTGSSSHAIGAWSRPQRPVAVKVGFCQCNGDCTQRLLIELCSLFYEFYAFCCDSIVGNLDKCAVLSWLNEKYCSKI